MVTPLIRVWLTWIILVGIILFEVRNAFVELRKHREAWKLAAHCVLLTIFGLMIVQAGLFCLNMPFDASGLYMMNFVPIKTK